MEDKCSTLKGYQGMIWMYINSVRYGLTVGENNHKDKKTKTNKHKKQLSQMEKMPMRPKEMIV